MVAGIGSAGAATFALDVEAGATVRYQWQTDVLKAWDGLEQRISLLAKPRQSFMFASVLTDAQQRAVLGTLAADAHEAPVFLLGLAFEALTVASSDADTINVHTLALCDWAEPGQRIVVVHPDGVTTGEAVVQSAAGVAIEVDANLTAVAVDGARVMPAMGVFLDADQAVDRYRTRASRWDLSARQQRFRYGSAGEVGAGATVTTFGDLPVWEAGLLAEGMVRQTLRSGAELVDLGALVTAQQVYDRADWGRAIGIHSSRRADWQWFKLFLDTVRGRWKSFLLPTGRPDLVAEGDASSGTLTITESVTDYVADWWPSLAHRRLAIVLADGTVAYRSVASAVDNGATQALTLSASVAGAIDHVEFLELVRLDSDEVQVTFTGTAFRAQLDARVVQR
jgi:hypothetical protein